MHLVVFEEEVETINSNEIDHKELNFNLIQSRWSLEPLTLIFQDPYGGSSTLSLIKSSTSRINLKDYTINQKIFDCLSG